MVNKAIIVGNLGRDPEVRTTPSGQPVANFSVATTRKWKDRDGNLQEKTEWHDVQMLGRRGDTFDTPGGGGGGQDSGGGGADFDDDIPF